MLRFLPVATTSVFKNCSSPQYGIIGQSHVIKCTIEIDSEGIYWFEQSNEREPVIRYEDETKIGRGYDNHEYDIENDGSLRINEVSKKHQMFYKIVVIDKVFRIYERQIRFVVHEESFEEIPFTDPFHQFGLVGKSAIIKLSIPSNFQGVYWYDERDTQDPFIRYEEETKLGRGYDDGEYDIFPNGSLKIKEVTINHDMVYSVVVIDNSYNTEEYKITFTTVVYPEQLGPRITNCTTRTFCHAYVEDLNNLRCSVFGARPAVHLEWFQKITEDELFLLASEYTHEPNDRSSYLFDSSVILPGERVPNIIPSVFVCKGTGPAIKSNMTFQQVLLVESKKFYDELENLTISSEKVINVLNKENVSLPCQTVTEESLIIWRRGSSVNKLHTILYSFYGNEVRDVNSETGINKTGHLFLFNVELYLEKVFVCIAIKNNDSNVGQIFKISVDGTANLNVSQGATTALPTTLSEKTLKVTEIKVTEPMGIVTIMEMAEETTETKTSMSKTETGPATATLKLTPTPRIQENQFPLFMVIIIFIVIFLVVVVLLASVIYFKRLHSKERKIKKKSGNYNSLPLK
ncbi:hypothetical protein HOLleu_17745 [Holothuria leucospilota]|uniref:Immunoglobulin domain-containing protein n=1 Tax=Holothuria leucospilota TaxID=206669 RepID=A0A9Q1C277_HOLLE|nr:hypothetical protein HOLleu_17745 [Holothuria leucospilota]